MKVEYRWPETWMKMAHLISTRSKDMSFKAGAVLVDSSERIILGLGFNGASPTISDDYDQSDRWLTRVLTSHAESNCLWYAVAAFGRDKLKDSVLYVNGRPCSGCVKEAERAGCRLIIWDDTNSSQPKMCDDDDWRKSCEIEKRSRLVLQTYSTY